MEFNKYFDHTFLKAFATEKDIDTLCQIGIPKLHAADALSTSKRIKYRKCLC